MHKLRIAQPPTPTPRTLIFASDARTTAVPRKTRERRSWRALLLALCALAELIYIMVMLCISGIQKLSKLAPAKRVQFDQDSYVRTMVTAVSDACCWLPRKTSCLPRSLLAARMLRRAGVASQLVLGITPPPLQGHAWVEVAERVVNDDPDIIRARYTVVARL